MTIFTEQQLEYMNAAATDIGAAMADWPDLMVAYWIGKARDELCDVCSPVTRLKDLRDEMDVVDRVLDQIEASRAAVRSAN